MSWAPDGYLLNLFCCKEDTAVRLAQQGILLDSASLDAPDAEQRFEIFYREHAERYGWRQKLVALPYGTALADLWETAQSSDDAAAVNEALARFAISQDTSLDPLTRFNALDSSLRLLQSLCDERPDFFRLASLARVAHDHASRAVAVSALSRLADTIAGGPVQYRRAVPPTWRALNRSRRAQISASGHWPPSWRNSSGSARSPPSSPAIPGVRVWTRSPPWLCKRRDESTLAIAANEIP